MRSQTVSGQTQCPQTSGHRLEVLSMRRKVLRSQTAGGWGQGRQRSRDEVCSGAKTRPLEDSGWGVVSVKQMKRLLPSEATSSPPPGGEGGGRGGSEASLWPRRHLPGQAWGHVTTKPGVWGVELDLSHHLAALLPVPPGIKGMGGVGMGSLHPRWYRGPALEDSFLPHLA